MKKLISIFSILAMLVAMIPCSVYASENGSCGTNAFWNYSNGVLTISGTGPMKNYTHTTAAPWSKYSDSIKTIIIKDGIETVGKYAFCDFTILTSVDLPNSITSIQPSAFFECEKIERIDIPNKVTYIGYCAFMLCSNLNKIDLPHTVTFIGERAFGWCESLTAVFIPSSVSTIERMVFAGCSMLKKIEIAPDNKTYHSANNCIIETQSKTLIMGCNTSSIPLDGSVTSIKSWAFSDCDKLKSIKIPSEIAYMGSRVFSGCTSLTDIYCEAITMPKTWDPSWYEDNIAKIHWDQQQIDYYRKGDINKDGTIDTFDYILIKSIYFGTFSPIESELGQADVNTDGNIDFIDCLIIKNIIFNHL